MSDDDLDELEQVACPSAGACGAQFTANTMATVSEAIGLALPYSAGAPAPYEIRDAFCMTAGEQVMDLIAQNIRPRDIVTRKALENAAAVVAASGGSTNAALHLPAIAHECGIEFDLFDVAEIFKRTPYIADLKPGGRYVAKDMFEAGGIPLLMKTLLDHGFLHGDCMTVTGRTIAENLKTGEVEPGPGRRPSGQQAAHHDRRRRRPEGQSRARGRDREGRRHERAEIHRPGALLRRRGSLLRGGQEQASTRKATCSSSATRAPRAAPACARCCRPPPRSTARAWATRSRSSPTAASPARRAASASAMSARKPRSAARSRLFSDGDIIDDRRRQGHARTSSCRRPNSPSARKTWKPREADNFTSGYLWKYAQQVGRRAAWRGHPSGRGGREVVLCGYLASSSAPR